MFSCSDEIIINNCVNPLIDDSSNVVITSVIDGDTYKFTLFKDVFSIRLLDIDCFEVKRTARLQEQTDRKGITLDSALALGYKARDLMDSIINGKSVLIYRDSTQYSFDGFGRLLRHVIYNNINLAEYLKQNGLDVH